MGNSIEEFTVVCQQQQTRRLAVEPTDRHHSFGHVDKIEHRSSPALIGRCRDVTGRLVQHDVPAPLPMDRRTVNPNLLARRVNPDAQFAHNRPVDAHATFNDHLFGASARC